MHDYGAICTKKGYISPGNYNRRGPTNFSTDLIPFIIRKLFAYFCCS